MIVSRRSVLVGLGLGSILPAASLAALEGSEAGTVVSVDGMAFGRSGAIGRSLVSGDRVFLGDTLTTGTDARLSARLGKETQLSLGEQCRLRIDKFLVDRGGTLT